MYKPESAQDNETQEILWDLKIKSDHLIPNGRLGRSGRDSVGRGQHSLNRPSGISTRTMHQSTTPSLSQTIWPRWASRQFLSLPIVQTLLPVTFGYSKAQRLSSWDNWGDERGCDEGHWHTHTRGLPWGLLEVVGTVQQMHFRRRKLLRRGLEFHVCTINKSAHTKKKTVLNSTRYPTKL